MGPFSCPDVGGLLSDYINSPCFASPTTSISDSIDRSGHRQWISYTDFQAVLRVASLRCSTSQDLSALLEHTQFYEVLVADGAKATPLAFLGLG